MKILLVNTIAKGQGIRTSLGTAILGTILKNAGHDIEVVDFNHLYHQGLIRAEAFEEPDLHTFGSYLLELSPDVICFYTMCNAYHISILTAKYVKENNPSIFVALGGPQASASALETMTAFSWIDLIGLGEGEWTITDIMEAVFNNTDFTRIDGVCYRENGSIRINPYHKVIEDLDKLPLIDYSLIHDIDKTDTVSIEVGRGCPGPL